MSTDDKTLEAFVTVMRNRWEWYSQHSRDHRAVLEDVVNEMADQLLLRGDERYAFTNSIFNDERA